MKKFLFINPFGIGDVLFTTPLARSIKEAYPDSVIAYWCNERTKDILKYNPHVDKFFALSRGDLKKIYQRSRLEGIKKFLGLLSGIKKEKFDAALDFSLDHRYSLISKLLGIRRRIGYDYKNRGRFLTEKIFTEGFVHKHVVEYYLDLLNFIQIKPQKKSLNIYVSESSKRKSKNILIQSCIGEKDLIVGIAAGAGASWGPDAPLKHWSAIKYAQLADRIINEFNAKVLILGDEAERAIADIIVNAMKNRTVDLVGKTTLEGFIAMISNLDVLITNDGGPLHIAVALGVKTVSIFGPVDESVYGPYPPSQRHIVIKKDLPCRPCYQSFRLGFCERNRECINSISTDEVFEAVRRLI